MLRDAAAVSDPDPSAVDFGALRRAPLQTDPFEYVVVPGFVPPDAIAAAYRDFPEIEKPANYDPATLTYGAGFQRLLDALESDAFAAAISAKFGIDLTDCPPTITVRKFCEASDGNIHTDHRSKLLTVLVYFNTEWTHDGGSLRMLRSSRDIEDYAAEVLPLAGTLLAFKRSNNSYHGHKQFVGERRMLQMSWLKSSRIAQNWQKISRFGTHLMKDMTGHG